MKFPLEKSPCVAKFYSLSTSCLCKLDVQYSEGWGGKGRNGIGFSWIHFNFVCSRSPPPPRFPSIGDISIWFFDPLISPEGRAHVRSDFQIFKGANAPKWPGVPYHILTFLAHLVEASDAASSLRVVSSFATWWRKIRLDPPSSLPAFPAKSFDAQYWPLHLHHTYISS